MKRGINHESDRSRAGPLYADIKRHLLDAIRSGELKPGDRLPSEAELVRQFSVSRMTAHRAVRELQASGLIIRRPGLGSFIAESATQGHIIEIRNIADEIRERGHRHDAVVVLNVEEQADPNTAPLLEVPVGTAIFHSIIVHRENDAPIQLEDRLVLASEAPDYGQKDFSAMTPNAYLVEVAPLERADHVVRAVIPDGRTRRLLEMEKGEPALLLVRRTWSRSRLVSHARLTHPAMRFEFSDSFEIG